MDGIGHQLRIVEEATPIQCLINPEPITVKGIKTFHPTFFHIYFGKKGIVPQFVAVEEKPGGDALGAIFKKATQIEVNKKWMGKVGFPNGLLRDNKKSIGSRTKIEMNIDTIREKLAYDLFQELGRGLFLVPKTRLSLQPIENEYNKKHYLSIVWKEREIKESLRIMSFFLPEYRDFAKAYTLDGDESIPFMKYLEKYHRPPESILTSEGQSVPLEGVMELLAVGRCLADVDLLGGGGCNAGFVWIRNDAKEIIGARAVKIDPGFAFCFAHQDLKDPCGNLVINTAKKLGLMCLHLQDLKDLQTSTGNYNSIVHWNCLTPKQQDTFIAVLLNTSRYLQSQEVLDLLFYREGKFSHPDPNYSNVAYMAKELAKQMCDEMKGWMEWQLQIYAEPLDQFKNRYPEQLLRMHYIDRYGELAIPMKKETFPIRELFTELMIVDSKDKDSIKTAKILKDMRPEGDSFKETINRLNFASPTISLDRLFEHHRKILLIGRAGIGKSTLCQKMAHDWASGRLWENRFEVVFWVPLRELNGITWENNAHFLLNIVIPRLFKHLPNSKMLCEPSKKILLILDGYDEATEALARQVENLLATAPFHILITSRPGKVESLKVDQVVENIGFSESQIKTYIDKFSKRYEKDVTDEVKGKELFSIIKENPHLYPMAHIPLQLQMIVSLYEKTGAVQQASSLTKLYQVMASELYDWTLRGQKQEEKDQHLLQLGKIASIGFQQEKLIIPHKKIQYLNLTINSLLETGILKKIEGEQPAYCFVHLTFQEYLTALYIQSKPLEKQKKFILENRHKPHYQLVLAFLAGLIHSQSGEMGTFFDILYQKSNIMTLSHPYLLELTLRCLNECEGFKKPLVAIENLVKEHPQIWDTLLSDGYSALLSAANQRQNQAFYWLADYYPSLLEKTGKWSKNKEQDITPLLLCAEKGNVGALEWLYQKNSKLISGFMNDGATPLHAAAFGGHVEAMQFLLEKDPNSKCMSNDQTIILHLAAFGGHVEAMKFLLEKDPTLISKFMNDGTTPLHAAAYGGHVEAMKFLLKKDPLLISKFKDDGSTPLDEAAGEGHVEAMKFLLEKDPKCSSRCMGDNGWDLLYSATGGGHVEAMKFLLEKYPKLISRFMSDGSNLFNAAVYGGHVEAMKFLHEKDPTLISRFGTLCYFTGTGGQVEAMKFLLEKDPKFISKLMSYSWTILQYAAFEGPLEAMKLLLEKEEPELTSKFMSDGWDLLDAAASGGHVEAMKFLFEKDPLLLSKFRNGDLTPLHKAAERGHVEAMKFLHEKDPKLISKFRSDGHTPLHSAASRHDVEAMKFLLEKDPFLISKFRNDGSTPLHEAAFGGHIEVMKFLLEKDPTLISKFKDDGSTPLHSAAEGGHVEAMKFLHEKDPTLISKFKNDGFTPLHSAASRGYVEAMKFLLEKEPLLISKFMNDGSTPFHFAASRGYVKAMKFLLEKDPTLISKFKDDGSTPLHSAAEGGHVEAMKFLHEKDPTLISKFKNDGFTPLHSAASRGYVEAMKFLLEKEPLLISKFMNDGSTPFHFAASRGYVKAMKFLLEKDPKLISKFKDDGFTPLYGASYGGHVEAMKFLLEKDPFLISKFMNNGSTPFHWTAEEGHIEAMKFLLEKDPLFLSKVTNDGTTPLHEVAFGGHVEAMKFLLEKEPKLISKFRNDALTPLHAAAQKGHIEVMKFLLETDSELISKFSNDGLTLLHSAAYGGYVEAMKFLLGKDPLLISKFMNNGSTPLHWAASGGHVEAMKFLHEKDPFLISKFMNNGSTPLHWAAEEGHIEAMKFLLEKDPKLISKFTEYSETPLHAAIDNIKGNVEAIKLLLEKDPSLISKFDIHRATPLHLAIQKGNVEAIRLLLEKDPSLISNDGWNLFHLAIEQGHVEAVKFLLEKDPKLISKFTHYRATPLHLAAKKGHVDIGKWLYQQEPTLLNLVDDMGWTALATAKEWGRTEFADWIRSVGGKEKKEEKCYVM